MAPALSIGQPAGDFRLLAFGLRPFDSLLEISSLRPWPPEIVLNGGQALFDFPDPHGNRSKVIGAAGHGGSPWATSVRRVLRTPPLYPQHRRHIAETDQAGTVGVHLTSARGGLLVGSVIAVDHEVPTADVLSVAQAIVAAEARARGSVGTCSLFDLPLGEGSIWTITEQAVETKSSSGREEEVTAILPAWSAETTVDLDDESLGIPAAARAVKQALGRTDLNYEAKQSAVARYSAVGFEAAAVTGLAFAASAPQLRPGLRRDATLRFGHPFAVVAGACQDHLHYARATPSSPWRGLPVFSAWVSEAVEA
jgi:hypothetical protein